jgi:group II intron reverse transcriptase/maturase
MRRDEAKARIKESESLSPQTIRIRHSLNQWSKSGRKHWDLYRHLYSPFVIYDALRLVLKNAGSGGLDGVQVQDIRDHEWMYVEKILEEIRSGRYKPSPVRRVFIPKQDGSRRPLGIPNIIDRVVQRALVLLLEPIYELKFYDFSHGFRPVKKAIDAAAIVANECYKLRQVLDADIEKFFDNVHHSKLVGMISQDIVDPRVLGLIKQFLKSGFQEVGKLWQASLRGTPQGGPLSPLLANIYLHYSLDEPFARVTKARQDVKMIRYADDFVVLCKHARQRPFVERLIRGWLQRVGLNLKSSKTKWVDMNNASRSYRSKFVFLGFKFHLRSFQDNPKRFWVARQPSEQARKRLHESLRQRLHVGLKLEEAKERLESVWYGWSEYFRYSNANRIFYRERRQVKMIYTRYMVRKFRRQKKAVPWSLIIRWRNAILRDLRTLTVRTDHMKKSIANEQ